MKNAEIEIKHQRNKIIYFSILENIVLKYIIIHKIMIRNSSTYKSKSIELNATGSIEV